MPRIEPPVTELSQPFWDATRERRLVAQRCQRCQRFVWYPRRACPGCLGHDTLRWEPVAGEGTIYTFNVMRRPGNPMMADEVPYVIALVDLDEGYRMSTNVVGTAPEAVACDQRVTVDWSTVLDDGRRLPMFTPLLS
ncbi:MAG TPA: OB-fold domain-containing protein [Acidimicrobiales bacterium]|nr:OB-fold domain-containing protein [Acidimicrobiales bacterium]